MISVQILMYLLINEIQLRTAQSHLQPAIQSVHSMSPNLQICPSKHVCFIVMPFSPVFAIIAKRKHTKRRCGAENTRTRIEY